MRRQTSCLLLLCAALFVTATPVVAQEESTSEAKPLVILGCEEEQCLTLVEQLKSNAPTHDYRAVPFIQMQPSSFELPQVGEGKQPVFLFTSPRAVEFFVAQKTLPEGALVIALGAGTQKVLEEKGYKCDLVSSAETTKGMAEEVAKYFEGSEKPIGDCHFIQPTCDTADANIQETLEALGATFTRVETCQIAEHPALKGELSQLSQAPALVVFYNPSAVHAWVNSSELRPAVVSADSATSEELKANGFSKIYQSSTPDESNLIATVLRALSEINK